MSVRMGLLAVLAQGPGYGYELRAELEARTGGGWPLNTGQIYSTLERLERDGLVAKTVRDADDRQQYELTKDGSRQLAEWVAEPVTVEAGRDDLAMKLAIVAALPNVDLADVVQAQRGAVMATLQSLTRTKPAAAVPESVEELGWLLVAESMIFAAEAQIRWLDYAEGLIGEALRAGLPVRPRVTTPVRRGRPARGAGRSGR